jgi:hypothetical protein
VSSASYTCSLYRHRESVFSLFQIILHTSARSIKTTTCRDSIQGKSMHGDAQSLPSREFQVIFSPVRCVMRINRGILSSIACI